MAMLRLVLVLALAACATTRPPPAVTPAARAEWERCLPVITGWCHSVAHGDPFQERQCIDNAARQYAVAGTEPARRQYLVAHHCRL